MIVQQLTVCNISITLQCFKYDGQSGMNQIIESNSHCIDYSMSLNMTVVQSSTVINVEDVSRCLLTHESGNWRELSLPTGIGTSGDWSLLCLMDLQLRLNGKYNTPPVATMISPIFIPEGIRQTIIIPTIDADNDQVRCRFANGSDECASVCYPNSLPNGTTISSDCILSITGSNVSDWYAVAIVVRKKLLHTPTNY